MNTADLPADWLSCWWRFAPQYTHWSQSLKEQLRKKDLSWSALFRCALALESLQATLSQISKEMNSLLVEEEFWSVDEAFSVASLQDESALYQTAEALAERLSVEQLRFVLRVPTPRHSELFNARAACLRQLAARGEPEEALALAQQSAEDQELYSFLLIHWMAPQAQDKYFKAFFEGTSFRDNLFAFDLFLFGCPGNARERWLIEAFRQKKKNITPMEFAYLCQAAKHKQRLCFHQIDPRYSILR